MGQATVDQQKARAFAGKLLSIYTGSALTDLIAVGHRTGLFEAAARGAGTSEEIAGRAWLHERHVREWLGGMCAGGIMTYDPATRTYALPPEHAACLTGDGPSNVAPQSAFVSLLGKNLGAIVACFRHGGGVPYEAFRPELAEAMDGLLRRVYDAHLVSHIRPAAPELPERLASGIRVADVGCGTGHAVNVMARAFPRSSVVGYDLGEDGIAAGRAEAAALGLRNARFEALDALQLPLEPKLGLITAFDAVHDQVAPAAMLRRVRQALADDGVFLMLDFKFSSNLEDNVGNRFAALYYGVSTLHCMPVSLAHGGAGLGTMWGTQLARRMLEEAGFSHVEILDSPRPQNCIYVCRP